MAQYGRPPLPRNGIEQTCPRCGKSVQFCIGPVCVKADGPSTAENVGTVLVLGAGLWGLYQVGKWVIGGA
jgi:hypothetical protein